LPGPHALAARFGVPARERVPHCQIARTSASAPAKTLTFVAGSPGAIC
jgi:hypothetical protein